MSSEVVRTTTTRELINRLRQEIYGGTYPPGARLRQGALATGPAAALVR